MVVDLAHALEIADGENEFFLDGQFWHVAEHIHGLAVFANRYQQFFNRQTQRLDVRGDRTCIGLAAADLLADRLHEIEQPHALLLEWWKFENSYQNLTDAG